MNVELLQKVKTHILEEPKRLDMNIIGFCVEFDDGSLADLPKCGTVGCIAGWASLLAHEGPLPTDPVERRALMSWDQGKKVLSLNADESYRLFSEPEITLFHEGDLAWPNGFAERYENAETDLERAQITAERIDHFIATKGRE